MRRMVRAGRESIEYELVQTARKSLELRVLPNQNKLFAPQGVRLKTADAFVVERADWLRDARERLREAQARVNARAALAEGAQVSLEGRTLTLHVARGAERVEARDGALWVWTKNDGGDAVRLAVRAYMIRRARAAVTARLEHFIPLVGRRPARVTIREQRTRWGSCSGQNNLNFNWKLIMAPPGALDYVVVHELCHLHEFNHSKRFWALVERFLPDYQDWKLWLKHNAKSLTL
ncbi:MAG: SprT family zinc-dependent metalloprotease [Christensenellaceae bacterium]|nr:SprT family zinc-dependent metalloprotease [Christensenellaceae bacterium]MEA5067543.1 SprT family zinc-dependent metalloprotease [Christensenellaceae bacterium]